MKIGLVTDSLAHMSFDDMLDTAAELGIQGIELNTSNWSTGPHCDLQGLLASETAQTRCSRRCRLAGSSSTPSTPMATSCIPPTASANRRTCTTRSRSPASWA